MPSPAAILQSLYELANAYRAIAFFWHVQVAGAALFLLFRRDRPSMDVAGYLLTLPIVSVSVCASHGGNVVTGAAFLLLTGALALCARTMPRAPIRSGHRAASFVGAMSLIMGAVYPHFVVVASPVQYLLIAPLGVLPCPTLSLIVGATLLGGGLGSRWWSGTLAFAALSYALFGIIVLSVWLDLVLLTAGIVLLVQGAAAGPHTRSPSPSSENPTSERA